MRKTENTVTAELRETREYLRKEVIPQQSLEILDRSIEALIESHVLDKSLKAGQTAPDFTLPNQNGTPVRLYDLLESGTFSATRIRTQSYLRLVFFRGKNRISIRCRCSN